MESAIARIRKWQHQRQALILSHYYEDGAIQDIADVVGDSLFLAQQGQMAPNRVVLLAGVVFMAETVKILSPEKTVLVPDVNAGCSLVTHSPFEKYLDWRRAHPGGIAVTYINSSAAVKAISDVIVTSSNAEKIISAIPQDRKILFGPDHNLGRYLEKKTGRKMLLWPGACEVHVLFSARRLFELRSQHSGAQVLAHPECVEEILKQADIVGSTSHLLASVKNPLIKEFIVATEPGILHQMRKARPDAEFFEAPAEGSCACNECPYMKLNTLEKIAASLETLSPQVALPPALMERARISLARMMDLTSGKSVTWPEGVQWYERPDQLAQITASV